MLAAVLPPLPRLAAWVLLLAGLLPGAAAADGRLDDTDSPVDAGPEFSLVTLNLYHDRDDWPRRRTQIVDTLRGAIRRNA